MKTSSKDNFSPSKVTDKFTDDAGDSTVTREEINASIISNETANEHSYVTALKKGLNTTSQKPGPPDVGDDAWLPS